MRLTLIVAVAENRVIGRDNKLIWRLPKDLRFFKKTTTGHVVIMGRKTYQSIGKPLPNRRNIVLSRQLDFRAPGCDVVSSLESALELAAEAPEVFVIGGSAVYREALKVADRLLITRIYHEFDGDAFFPEVDWSNWEQMACREIEATEKRPWRYSFLTYQRRVDAK